MEGFRPKLKLKTELQELELQNKSWSVYNEMGQLSKLLYAKAIEMLKDAIKDNNSKSIVLCITDSTLSHEFRYDSSNYSYSVLWDLLKKRVDEDELILYEIGNGTSILTY